MAIDDRSTTVCSDNQIIKKIKKNIGTKLNVEFQFLDKASNG